MTTRTVDPAVIAREMRLSRIRERIATSRPDEGQLRAMLVLAHEVVRARAPSAILAREVVDDAAPRAAVGDYSELVARIQGVVKATVPAGSRILVVSRGDGDLLFPGFDTRHFPQAPDGGYAGFYPHDSAGAIAHLEDCRGSGAEFLVVPATAHWWLDYYGDFTRHLVVKYRVAHHGEECLIFDLRPQPEGDGSV
jgi:hypothetical protein